MKRLILIIASMLIGVNCFAESPVVLQTLLMEAKCDGVLGMQAVAEVIRNRAKDRGLSFEEVCLQKKQFSCWNDRLDAVSRVLKFGKDDYRLAEQAWRLSKTSNITKGANLYANLSLCSPSWASSPRVKRTVKILHHTFFKEC